MIKSIVYRACVICPMIALMMFMNSFVATTQASSVLQRKDILSRQKNSVPSNHTIQFMSVNGVASGQTITLQFATGFSIPGLLDFTDIDMSYGPSTGTENELSLAAVPAGSVWGAVFSGQTLTLTAGTTPIPANQKIIIEIGTNATTGVNGDQQISNPGSIGQYVLTIGGTFGESGEIGIPIIDEDQVNTTAAIDPVMIFDLDIGTGIGESNPPYIFDLGILNAGQVATSGTGSPVRPRVLMELKTSASGGATVSVQGVNGGMKSPSQNYLLTTVDAGSPITLNGTAEGFGLCVASVSATAGVIQAVAPYNGACSTTSHQIGGVTTAPRTIIDTAGAPALGANNDSAEIFLKAVTVPTTPAANDYSETLSFVATGIF